MVKDTHWKKLGRNTIHDTRFLQVHLDKIELPDGSAIDDYSVVTLPVGVIVVATDQEGKLILFREYKYAVDETVLMFPAGGADNNETPTEAAKRELLEEAGYTSDEVEYMTALTIYPSKVDHATHFVRIKNAKKVADAVHEATETIGEIELVAPEQIPQLIQRGEFTTMFMMAAFALAFPEYLKQD